MHHSVQIWSTTGFKKCIQVKMAERDPFCNVLYISYSLRVNYKLKSYYLVFSYTCVMSDVDFLYGSTTWFSWIYKEWQNTWSTEWLQNETCLLRNKWCISFSSSFQLHISCNICLPSDWATSRAFYNLSAARTLIRYSHLFSCCSEIMQATTPAKK